MPKASKASQAQSKLKQIERMKKIEAPTSDDKKVSFSSPAAATQRPARHPAQNIGAVRILSCFPINLSNTVI
ncbi:MAG: hypothetical protein QM813_24850 [Verrucomicrobiota bacterium]